MTDEQQIRDVIAAWSAATKAGDVDAVLALMTDDAVFLVAGQPPMSRDAFATASRAMAGQGGPRIDATSDVEEIVVAGELAVVRTRLRVAVTPPGGAAPTIRAGHALTVFRRQDGRWRLFRDANLLVPVPDGA